MIKFIILIGQKYFSNYVAQSNYWIIQTKLLTVLFKINIEAYGINIEYGSYNMILLMPE